VEAKQNSMTPIPLLPFTIPEPHKTCLLSL
jgi:hypothetical protein